MKYRQLLVGSWLAVICLIGFLLFRKSDELHYVAQRIHQSIKPLPNLPETTKPTSELDQGEYLVEVRILCFPYSRKEGNIPTVRGCIEDFDQLIHDIQNCLHFSMLRMIPIETYGENPSGVAYNSYYVNILKSHERIELEYRLGDGVTRKEIIELPEGKYFVTNVCKHPIDKIAIEPILPDELSWFQCCQSYQMERMLVVRYTRVRQKLVHW
jgi:hypothetical protein